MRIKKSLLAVLTLIAISAFASCDDSKDSGPDYYIKFSFGGARYSFTRGFSDIGEDTPFGNYYSSSTWMMASDPGTVSTSITGDYIQIEFVGDTAGEYTADGLNIWLELGSASWRDTSSDLTVTKYDEIGGVITGDFYGLLDDGGSTQEGINGSFRVKRMPDSIWNPK